MRASIAARVALRALFRAAVSMEVRAFTQARFGLPAHDDARASQGTCRSVGDNPGYRQAGASAL
ncbi:hypothetical protein XEUVG41_04960 [Xanthomonas euvesicatoria]|nr:hypothetical protein XEUV684_16110 [Xanthomonas euvesicatoria]KLA69665.1 hypothetical protein XEUV695_05170 [Xanthomonas euvesicatoria]KLA82080.1 hypothetical protein XEUVG41_04960 [Xanthomonas euvesicatoria]KLA82591.1 hypothetical protein XEUVH32_05045 [Xanthomonas euvesicatoria]KLA88605.1 hypothetical protein XEUVL32_05185 [Xanthomonas euvesicatoria]